MMTHASPLAKRPSNQLPTLPNGPIQGKNLAWCMAEPEQYEPVIQYKDQSSSVYGTEIGSTGSPHTVHKDSDWDR